MSLTSIPTDFGAGGANIGDGSPKLGAILEEHRGTIEDHTTAIAANTAAISALEDAPAPESGPLVISDATITTAVVTPGSSQAATVQLKDQNGASWAGHAVVHWWLSNAGSALGAASDHSGSGAVSVTTGVPIALPATPVDYPGAKTPLFFGVALTDSTGKVVIEIGGLGPCRFNMGAAGMAKSATGDFVDQTG